MADKELDIDRIMRQDESLPPSPRDPFITKAGYISLMLYLVAALCAWQIGKWWGVGLIVILYIISTIDELVYEQHRQELVEMHGKLVMQIALKSDIMDDKIPTRD